MNQSGKIAMGVLAIAAIAGFTVLLTSDKAEKTRNKISKKGKKLWKKTKETVSDLADDASKFASKMVKEGEDLL